MEVNDCPEAGARKILARLITNHEASVASAVIRTYGTIMAKPAGLAPREPSA